MEFARPYTVLCPSLDGPVLDVLYHTTRPLTGGEISRIVTRGSERGVRLVLGRLVAHGLVTQESAGAASLYTLNRGHVAFSALQPLMGLLDKLHQDIRERIGTWDLQPDHAFLFGSAARGDGDLGSDVDIFIVRPDAIESEDTRWRDQLQDLADSIHRWTGNHASMIEVSGVQLRAIVRRGEPVLEALRQSIPLAGDQFQTLG
jgi:predicted nucleotidyltransferase